MRDHIKELERLVKLRNEGALSSGEFETERRRVLASTKSDPLLGRTAEPQGRHKFWIPVLVLGLVLAGALAAFMILRVSESPPETSRKVSVKASTPIHDAVPQAPAANVVPAHKEEEPAPVQITGRWEASLGAEPSLGINAGEGMHYYPVFIVCAPERRRLSLSFDYQEGGLSYSSSAMTIHNGRRPFGVVGDVDDGPNGRAIQVDLRYEDSFVRELSRATGMSIEYGGKEFRMPRSGFATAVQLFVEGCGLPAR